MIIGLAGAIGTGKSFTQLKQALQYAEEKQKQLVFNFEINTDELYKYASMPKHYDSWVSYIRFEFNKLIIIILQQFGFNFRFPKAYSRLPWVCRLCKNGGIIQIPSPKKLEALLIPESIVCLDEAGILLNSRDFANTSKELLADLAQSRKDGCDLLWAAQFEEQVDKQLRLLTQYWIHCDSVSVYDKKLRRPKLFWKKIYWFRAADYMHWLNNIKDRGSHIKARFAYAFKYEGGLLTPADKQLFNIYNSFARLDKVYGGAKIVTIHHCKLPLNYYINRLSLYFIELDPLSPKYQPLFGFYFSRSSSQASFSISCRSRPQLIKDALALARSKSIAAPYFKNLSDQEIEKFISTYSQIS